MHVGAAQNIQELFNDPQRMDLLKERWGGLEEDISIRRESSSLSFFLFLMPEQPE